MPYSPERTLLIPGESRPEGGGCDFFDAVNIDELNLIVLSPACIHTIWVQSAFYWHERPSWTAGRARNLLNYKALCAKRISRILQWVEEGHTLLIEPQAPPALEGFADDRKTTKFENINNWEPFNKVTLRHLPGRLVEAAGTFVEEFGPFAHLFSYTYTLSGAGLIPIYETSSTQARRRQVVAGFFPYGRGCIVFSPILSQIPSQYLEAITNLQARRNDAINDLPNWVDQFQVQEEKSASDRIAVAQAAIEKAQQTVDQEHAAVLELKRTKLLYAGSGTALVEEAIATLKKFDLQAVEGPHPRADILVWDGTHLAAVEVKGLEGAAREVNVRQADTWAAEVNRALVLGKEERRNDPVLVQYAEKLAELGLDVNDPIIDLECRGLMIITTFRKTPLNERDSESFPDPVAKLVDRLGIAALTGLDLYCLLEQAKADASKTAEIARELLTFVGVMPPLDWRRYIKAY